MAKRFKRPSKFQPEWARYNMSASKKGPSYVHCKVCAVDISVFRDYRVAPIDQLPAFVPSDDAAVDYFWFAMGELKVITDLTSLRFGIAKILLVLPHSNADPERLFSMVRKIETEHRKRLDPSTICDLLSTKINNDNVCYDNKHLVSDSFLRSVNTATRRSFERSTSMETMDSSTS